jgi:anti-sigma factor RsiW
MMAYPHTQVSMDADGQEWSHLEPNEVAAYLDGELLATDRSRIEAHLAECAECRAELTEVARLLHSQPRRRRGWLLPVGVAAAAAVVLVLALPRPQAPPASSSGFREPAITTTVAPVVLAPRGTDAAVRSFIWTEVPHADRYRVTVFDETGRVVWETQTTDTAALAPDTVRLQAGAPHFWKVEAETAPNRWTASSLVEFSPGPPRP